MTVEASGVYALALLGLALLIGQRSAASNSLGGFVIAFLLLSAASFGADLQSDAPADIRAVLTPALARIVAASGILICLILAVPQIMARIDRIWIIWSILAISEVSSLAFRSRVFDLGELFSSGIAAIAAIVLASTSIHRSVKRRQTGPG